MAVDLTLLARLAPPDTTPEDLQAAADMYAANDDAYAAAAELWVWTLAALEPPADPTPGPGGTTGAVASVTAGDQSVTYAASAVNDPVALYTVRKAAIEARIRFLSSRSKASSVLLRKQTRTVIDCKRWAYDPWDYQGWDGQFVATREPE